MIQKTGLLSFLMVSCFAILCLTTFILNGNQSKHEFYIIRTFITVLIFFIITPGIVILKNDNISLHSLKLFSSFATVKKIMEFIINFHLKCILRNTVLAEPVHKIIVWSLLNKWKLKFFLLFWWFPVLQFIAWWHSFWTEIKANTSSTSSELSSQS